MSDHTTTFLQPQRSVYSSTNIMHYYFTERLGRLEVIRQQFRYRRALFLLIVAALILQSLLHLTDRFPFHM